MAPSSHILTTFFLLTTVSLFSPSNSAACTSQVFTNNRLYAFCIDLPALNSYLHWTYNPVQSTLSIAFVAPPARPEGWVSWAINPTSTGMVGSQALIAFRGSSGDMTVKTYNVSSYGPLNESEELWYEVRESSAEFSGGVIRLFATLMLPEMGKTTVNHVWQVGPSVMNGVPDKHGFQPGNLNAKGSLDLLRGQSTVVAKGSLTRTFRRNVHGVLNVVSWGLMFPMGIVIARYLRTFPSADPAWFYLHVVCQVFAYIVGVVGWGTGLILGSESSGITYSYHRYIGIALFALATVQVFALLLRPKKDHKYRFYWNIYHHGVGYTILVLAIINVFKGFSILRPDPKYSRAYVVAIVVLGGIALLLEAITWIIVLRRGKSGNPTAAYEGFGDGQNRQQSQAP